MKTCIIVLCLLASGGWATATITQTKFSPDKGDRLYVDSDVQKMDFTDHNYFSAWATDNTNNPPADGLEDGRPTIMSSIGRTGWAAVVHQ